MPPKPEEIAKSETMWIESMIDTIPNDGDRGYVAGRVSGIIIRLLDKERQHQAKLEAELAQLQLEVGALRGAIQKAADQIKRGEWNSHNSGTWTILNDVLSTPPLYSAVVELMNAGSYLCRRLANVSGGSDVEAEELWLKALSTLKKLMGRES